MCWPSARIGEVHLGFVCHEPVVPRRVPKEGVANDVVPGRYAGYRAIHDYMASRTHMSPVSARGGRTSAWASLAWRVASLKVTRVRDGNIPICSAGDEKTGAKAMKPSLRPMFPFAPREPTRLTRLSDAEHTLISKQGRRSTRVNENDIVGLLPTPVTDERDQAGQTLPGVHRIKYKPFQATGQPDRLDGCLVRYAVGRTGVAGYDVYSRLVERCVQPRRGEPSVLNDVSPNTFWFCVDVDPDNAHLRHHYRSSDDKAGLRTRTAGAMYNGAALKIVLCDLRGDFHDGGRVGDSAEFV